RATDEEAAAWSPDRTEGQVMDRAAGRRLFTDGVERTVYEDNEGRQYVLGPDGEHVDGQWLAPADEPAVVGGQEGRSEMTAAAREGGKAHDRGRVAGLYGPRVDAGISARQSQRAQVGPVRVGVLVAAGRPPF